MHKGSRRRSLARRNAMQALYQWQLTGDDTTTVLKQFQNAPLNEDEEEFDWAYFSTLFNECMTRYKELESYLEPLLDRPLIQLDPVEKAILMVGAAELAWHIEVPFRVAINEAVELAKSFGAEASHQFINGVLDKLAKQKRAVEVAQRRNQKNTTPNNL